MTEEQKSFKQIVEYRKEKLEKLISKGVNPYPALFKPTHKSSEVILNFDALNNSSLHLAGRIISIRKMGKASFFNIQVPSYCPHIGAIMTSFGDNISLHSSTFNLDSTYYDEDINFRQMNFSNDGRISQSLSDEIQITLLSGQEFTRFSYTPICAEAPENPSVFLDWRALEDNNQSDYQVRLLLFKRVARFR